MSVRQHEIELCGASGPRVTLLEATGSTDAAGLRALARALAAAPGDMFSARSYRFPYALVARHSRPVGIDIERHQAYPEGFASSVCTPLELSRMRRPPSDMELTELWCGKEAIAKALGDALAYDPRRLESPLTWPDGRAGPWHAQELALPAGHVAWLCWREGSPASSCPRLADVPGSEWLADHGGR